MAQQPMGQQSFFYYSPEHTSDHRNQGHYTPQPTSMPMMDYFQYPLSHSRPQSAGPSVIYPAAPQYISQAMLTPSTSPKPRQHRPTILMQHEQPFMMRLDTSYMPATPTLSASGSFSSRSIDSPPAYGMMPTPVELDYFGNTSLQSVKSRCEEEAFNEVLSSEWTNRRSPPVTPGKHHCKTA